MSELYKKLWNKIYNPHSGCPDVSVGDVLISMAEILVENDKRDLETVDKFILAILSILEKSGEVDLPLHWNDASYHYSGINEYDLPFDKYEKFNSKERKRALKSINKLIKLKLIEHKDKYYVTRQ